MAVGTTSYTNYLLEFTSSDTEYVRLNILDNNGNPILVGVDYTCTMGIKRKELDSAFIVPEKEGTMYDYTEFTQPYGVEFKFDASDTTAILNYSDKERKKLKAFYDVELVHISSGDVTTILSGPIEIKRSISGGVI